MIIIIETTIKNQKRKPNKVVPYEKEDRSVLLPLYSARPPLSILYYRSKIDFPLFPPPPANRLMSYHQPLYSVKNSGKRRRQQQN